MHTHPLSRRCIIFLKQDSASDINATDDIDIAIPSVRLSVRHSGIMRKRLNADRDGQNFHRRIAPSF